jgi:uncharacterized protein DUF3592
MRNFRAILACVVVGLVTGIGVPFLFLSPHKYRALADHGVITNAAITYRDCPTIGYRFEVDERVYVAVCHGSCWGARVGDPLRVWYLPSDPTVNSNEEPFAALVQEEGVFALGAILGPGVLLGAWTRRKLLA